MNELPSTAFDSLTRSNLPARVSHPGPLLVMDSGYPSIGGGGCESQCGTLGKWFVSEGYDTTLIVPVNEEAPATARDIIDGLPIRRIGYPRIKLLGALLLHMKLVAAIWQHRTRSTMIHMHIGGWLAVTACVAGRLFGLPVLVKMTGHTELVGGALDLSSGISGRLKRFGLRAAAGYQAISSEIVGAIVQSGLNPDKVHYIPNAVDVSRFSRHATRDLEMRERLCPGAQFVALFVGRFETVKNVATLFAAWAQALGDDKSAWLVLAGTGSQESQLRDLLERLAISDRVVFLGDVLEMETVTNWADISVLPSFTEGLSNSMLECLAAGLPMIASNVGGNPDFVKRGQTGWLFDPTNIDELATVLTEARALDTSRLDKMSAMACAEVTSRVALDRVGQQIAEIFDNEQLPFSDKDTLSSV